MDGLLGALDIPTSYVNMTGMKEPWLFVDILILPIHGFGTGTGAYIRHLSRGPASMIGIIESLTFLSATSKASRTGLLSGSIQKAVAQELGKSHELKSYRCSLISRPHARPIDVTADRPGLYSCHKRPISSRIFYIATAVRRKWARLGLACSIEPRIGLGLIRRNLGQIH